MNFEFTDDQKMLSETVQNFLGDNAPLSLCRSAQDDYGQAASEAIWPQISALGWTGITIPEAFGGVGLGHLELAVVAEQMGRSLAPIPFATSAYLATEALLIAANHTHKSDYLPGLASGEIVGCVALAEKSGMDAKKLEITTCYHEGQLTGHKPYVVGGLIADIAIIMALNNGAVGLALVELDQDSVIRSPVDAIDHSLGGASLKFYETPAHWLNADAATIEALLVRAAVPYAFEQLGGAERALEMTRDYVAERYAFGKPIGSFQALKHRLADVYVDIQLARGNCLYAAWALENNAADLVEAASAARISATKAFDLISREMVQMHGGVGYTWEYDCHLFYRRARALSVNIGPLANWQDRLIHTMEAQTSI
jgi:alkylation response protein AidB-like acyl-CoA dehydrogenase